MNDAPDGGTQRTTRCVPATARAQSVRTGHQGVPEALEGAPPGPKNGGDFLRGPFWWYRRSANGSRRVG